MLRALLSGDKVKRQALLNRQRDYLRLSSNLELLKFHSVIDDLLQKANEHWGAYDYGQSYFYQGYKELGLSGLRNTEARIEAMGLLDIVAGKSIFEVGMNTGFLSMQLAASARHVTGVEINPFLVEIAQYTAEYLEYENFSFVTSSFEDIKVEQRYEVLLSFANHSTYDGQTSQDLDQYFAKCHGMLEHNGIMVFESHARGFEHPSVEHTFEIMSHRFKIGDKKLLDYGTELDRGRTMAIASPL